jgi:hypothetical protein
MAILALSIYSLANEVFFQENCYKFSFISKYPGFHRLGTNPFHRSNVTHSAQSQCFTQHTPTRLPRQSLVSKKRSLNAARKPAQDNQAILMQAVSFDANLYHLVSDQLCGLTMVWILPIQDKPC